MRAALVVHRVGPDRAGNLAAMLRLAGEAADAGADLAVFSETALTGLVNTDDPGHDLPLGEPIPGPATEALGRAAREHGLWIAAGLFEREGDTLYDSAVLVDPEGVIALRYRRLSPGWLWPGADRRFYGRGKEVGVAETPWGRVAFLLCGDLFDDEVAAQARDARPGLLLVPFVRSFPDGGADTERWEREEVPDYAERVAWIGAHTLLVAYLGGEFFGGALAIAADGRVTHSLPIGRPGTLLADIATPPRPAPRPPSPRPGRSPDRPSRSR